jgi:hypothetical protein
MLTPGASCSQAVAESKPRLREYKGVSQQPGGRRRWFESEGMDLVVWYDLAGARTGFQFLLSNHALTWRVGSGFQFRRVSEGSKALSNQTPILVATGDPVPWERLIAQFEERSELIDADLRADILGKLQARG